MGIPLAFALAGLGQGVERGVANYTKFREDEEARRKADEDRELKFSQIGLVPKGMGRNYAPKGMSRLDAQDPQSATYQAQQSVFNDPALQNVRVMGQAPPPQQQQGAPTTPTPPQQITGSAPSVQQIGSGTGVSEADDLNMTPRILAQGAINPALAGQMDTLPTPKPGVTPQRYAPSGPRDTSQDTISDYITMNGQSYDYDPTRSMAARQAALEASIQLKHGKDLAVFQNELDIAETKEARGYAAAQLKEQEEKKNKQAHALVHSLGALPGMALPKHEETDTDFSWAPGYVDQWNKVQEQEIDRMQALAQQTAANAAQTTAGSRSEFGGLDPDQLVRMIGLRAGEFRRRREMPLYRRQINEGMQKGRNQGLEGEQLTAFARKHADDILNEELDQDYPVPAGALQWVEGLIERQRGTATPGVTPPADPDSARTDPVNPDTTPRAAPPPAAGRTGGAGPAAGRAAPTATTQRRVATAQDVETVEDEWSRANNNAPPEKMPDLELMRRLRAKNLFVGDTLGR